MDLRMLLEDLDAWKAVSSDDFHDAEDTAYGDDLMQIETFDGTLHYFVHEREED